nr:hypothetical protein CFP56_11804 [Quercus suber]
MFGDFLAVTVVLQRMMVKMKIVVVSRSDLPTYIHGYASLLVFLRRSGQHHQHVTVGTCQAKSVQSGHGSSLGASASCPRSLAGRTNVTLVGASACEGTSSQAMQHLERALAPQRQSWPPRQLIGGGCPARRVEQYVPWQLHSIKRWRVSRDPRIDRPPRRTWEKSVTIGSQPKVNDFSGADQSKAMPTLVRKRFAVAYFVVHRSAVTNYGTTSWVP